MIMINSSNSHPLDPSNISPLEYWKFIQGCDWNLVYESSLHRSFESWLWVNLYPHFPPRLSVFSLIHDIRISSTLLISHCKYIKGLDKVEIGIHLPQPSPHPHFRVLSGENFGSWYLTFHNKIEFVQTDSAISYQLDTFNPSWSV